MLVGHHVGMIWNRTQEDRLFRTHLAKGRLGFVTGRRRVGKTALLVHTCAVHDGIYHQAIDGTPTQQIAHVVEELREQLPIFREVLPKTWSEFFRLLAREKLPPLLVFDEFPYWVNGDPTLPSVLQKWVDHDLPKQKTLVCLSGSSQSMLYAHLLNHAAPLYGRSAFHLHLRPMSYHWFGRALKLDIKNPTTFERYSLVGGVPHYWKLLPKGGIAEQATELYFAPNAILSEEPTQLLRDEEISGALPKSIIDLVGRGVQKPSELAARLGTPQGNLSRPLALLLDLGIITRQLPFGESNRTTKRVIYTLTDAALAFYYGTALPHRSRWAHYTKTEQLALIHEHASRQWEHYCRHVFPGSGRYWEGEIEIDLIAPDGKEHIIAECKWRHVDKREETALLRALQEKFERSRLHKKFRHVRFRIFSQENLAELARREGD